MNPHSIRCTGCPASLPVARCLALHAVGHDATLRRVREDDLLWMPVKVAWCGACNAPTLAEDLRPLPAPKRVGWVIDPAPARLWLGQ